MSADGVPRRTLALLWVSQFVNTTGLMMLVPIMPFTVQDMDVRGLVAVQTWAGIAIAAPAIALTVATPVWGRVGDRLGRHWMVVRALLGLALAMVVMAAATTPLMLVVGRLLQGSLGGVVEAAQAFAGASGPSHKRGSALGKSFSATAAGALLGPLLGGVLVGLGELDALMLGIAAIAAMLALASAVWLREPETTVSTPPSSGGSRTSAGFWQVPGARSLAVAAVAVYFGVYGLIPVFATHVQRTVATDQAGLWVGVFQSVTWGATLVASLWWGAHNDRAQRPVRAMAVASAVCAVSIAAQALPLGEAGLIVLRLVQGAAFAALAQSLFLHVGRHASAEHRGGAVGAANSFLLVGQGAGPLLAGPMAVLVVPSSAIAVLGAACAVASLCCLRPARDEAARAAAPVPEPPPTARHPVGSTGNHAART